MLSFPPQLPAHEQYKNLNDPIAPSKVGPQLSFALKRLFSACKYYPSGMSLLFIAEVLKCCRQQEVFVCLTRSCPGRVREKKEAVASVNPAVALDLLIFSFIHFLFLVSPLFLFPFSLTCFNWPCSNRKKRQCH